MALLTAPRGLAGVLSVALAATALSQPMLATHAQSPESEADGLRPLAVFDDYVNGSLRTQGPWVVNTSGAPDGAFASDEVPASLSGRAMALLHGGEYPDVPYRGNAYAALGDLSVAADSAASTVFWEILPESTSGTDVSLGLSSDESPGLGADTTGDEFDLDDYGPQVMLDERGLVVRDGTEEKVLDTSVADGEILRVWLNVDNVADTFQVFTAGPGEDAAPAASGGDATFAFRTSDDQPLITFLVLNDADDLPSSSTYVDNIYVSPAQATTADPSPSYAEVLDFEEYGDGALDAQDGWAATSGATVAADPVDADNRALQVLGPNTRAVRPLPEISDTDTGTIFFRFRREGLVDTSLGLTDVDAPTTFSQFQVQTNNQRNSNLQIRPRSGFVPVGLWPEGAWQCVWMVADNATDTYRVYSRGGPYERLTRLPIDQEMEYAFRTGTTNPLDRFFLLQGAQSPGSEWVDDIAIDQHSANLRVPSGDESDCQFIGGDADLPLVTPVKETPQPTDVTFHLSEVATIPASSTGGPAARINYLREVPGRPDVYAVPDLNGTTWLVEGTTPVEYFDMAQLYPDFVTSPSLGTGNGFITFHPEFETNGLFYTVHTEAGDALTSTTPTLPAPADTRVHGVVTEWHADDPSSSTFSGTRREIMRIGFSTFLHGIQQIDFNQTAEPGDPDYGLLYLGVGDGNQNPNFAPNPQQLDKPQGKVLRIDPTGDNAPGGRYGIPADNPFVDEPGALGEVWALGFRNPHRFSWDPATGRMFLGMIGENSVDAVYDLQAGDNAGWNEREGAFVFKKTDTGHVYPLPDDDEQYGYDYPALNIGRNTGGSLSGGFVYRGSSFPEFQGSYIFGDIVTGAVRFTSAAALKRGGPNPMFFNANIVGPDGQPTTMRELVGSSRVDLRFAFDDEGEIYLISKANGKIYEVTDITGTQERPSCDFGPVTVDDVNAGENWAPLTPEKWEFPGDQIILTEPGTDPGPPRRPFEYATLTAGPEFESLRIDAEVRLDESTSASNRDIVLIWNYQSPTRFYYAHISQDNTSYAHNGIFVVNDADRLRIDDQWDGSVGAPGAIDDMDWHDVRLEYCADTGRIAVYVDGSDMPLITATDTTFTGGRVGFGSFDNFGRARNVTVTGTPYQPVPVVELEASRTEARLGDTVELTWSSTGADQLEASGAWSGTKPASGSEVVTLTEVGTSTFRLTGTNANGTTEAEVSVTVTLPPTTLDVDAPPMARAGQRVWIRATALEPHEPYTVSIGDDQVASSIAGADGKVRTLVVVPSREASERVTVTVRGSVDDRVGTDEMMVRAR